MKHPVKTKGSFRYIDEGQGDALILLHGLFGSLANFEQTVSYFSDSYRTIVPLLPLYELPIRETTVEGMVKYLCDFMEEMAVSNATFVGNSLGGHIAILFTLQFPEKVTGLVLTGSSGLFERAFGDTLPRRGDYNYIKHKTEQTFYNPDYATKELVDEVFDIVSDREKALRVLSMAKSAVRHNLAEELCHISTPVFLIWGKNDSITPPEVGEEFHKLLPNSELVTIDCCGHAAMMEQPILFNELLDGFLRSLKQIA